MSPEYCQRILSPHDIASTGPPGNGRGRDLQSLRRVQQYLDAHADVLAAVNASDLRKTLDATVAGIEPTVTAQDACTRDMRGERKNQRVLERQLRGVHMGPIAKFARAELAGVPHFAALTPEARDLVADRLVAAARAMGKAAQPFTALFLAGHFPRDFLVQLGAAADALMASLDAHSAKKGCRANATKAVDEAVTSGRALVTRLDARVTRIVAGNPALLQEWRVTKRVQLKPGVPRGAQEQAPMTATASALVTGAAPEAREGQKAA